MLVWAQFRYAQCWMVQEKFHRNLLCLEHSFLQPMDQYYQSKMMDHAAYGEGIMIPPEWNDFRVAAAAACQFIHTCVPIATHDPHTAAPSPSYLHTFALEPCVHACRRHCFHARCCFHALLVLRLWCSASSNSMPRVPRCCAEQ